jgi:hypothetical protein
MGAFFPLDAAERICWQSCPAPRAYVFRRWRLSLACLPVWLGLGFWLGCTLYSGRFSSLGWFVWYAAIWLLVGYGAVGQLFAARLLWRWDFYLLTDRRIWVRRGLLGRHVEWLALVDVEIHRVTPLSGSLATVQLRSRHTGTVLTLYCLEGAAALIGFLLPAAGGKPVDSPACS